MQEERPEPSAPLTDAERLWAHYQKPRGSSWPADRLPMRRWEWLRLIQCLELSAHVKAVAGALAAFCDGDGSNVITTDPAVYHGLGIGERQLRSHVAVLRDLRLLHVVEHGGGRGRARKHGGASRRELNENAIVCQLTAPADGALPRRLDGDFLPIDDREKGKEPVRATAAAKAARTRNTGRQTAGESTATAQKLRQPDYRSNTETPADALPQFPGNTGTHTAGVSALEPGNSGIWASGESWAALAYSGSDTSAVSAADEVNTGSHTAGESSGARQPDYRSFPETAAAPLPKLRQPGFQNSGSPAAAPVVKTLENLENPTTRVVSLGGDLTSADPTEPPSIDPEYPGPDPADSSGRVQLGHAAGGPDLEVVGSTGSVPDSEYEWALDVLHGLDQADIGERLSDAQSELEAEAAAQVGSDDDGVTVYADSRQIMIRAARIVLRAQRGAQRPARPLVPPRPEPEAGQ